MSTDYTRLRALAEAATPGPWETAGEIDGYYAARNMTTVVRTAYPAPNPFGPRRIVTVGQTRPHVSNEEANVAFIAAANPQTVLELLDECAQGHSERESLRNTLARVQALVLAWEATGDWAALLAAKKLREALGEEFRP